MAEFVFIAAVNDRQLTHKFVIDSAATSRYEIGNPPDKRSVATCKKRLGSKMPPVVHRARQITSEDFHKFDHVLCMDQSNLTDLMRVQPKGSKAKVELLGSYDPQGDTIIEDPYYGGDDGFAYNFDQVTRSVNAFLDKYC